jgi:transcriptional regulator with XRE-family HTH domain
MRTELTYGKKIQELRRAKAWTQEQLAEAAGLDVRTIQRIEKDQTKSPETLQAIAGAFDVGVEDLRTTTLIPQTKLAGTWLATSYREFITAERTRPAQQFARIVASPLSEEGKDRVDELLRQIFADRELIEPNEPELWSCYEEQIREPLQLLFDLGQAFFIVDERRDFILPDSGGLQPTQRCIPNWRVLYYVVVPRHGCFQAGPEKPMHRFNSDCRESATTFVPHGEAGFGRRTRPRKRAICRHSGRRRGSNKLVRHVFSAAAQRAENRSRVHHAGDWQRCG